MKKRNTAIAMIAVALILVTAASASSGTVQKTLSYNDIKISLDGQEVIPQDINGNEIEPFIIDGTTYLPIRGIASALGLDVDWDQATKTVLLKSAATPSVEDSQTISAEYVNLYEIEGIDGIIYLDLRVKNTSNRQIMITLINMAVNEESVPLVLTASPVVIRPGMSASGPFLIPTTTLSIDHATEVKKLIFDIEARDPDSLDLIDTLRDFWVTP